jgi:hypothetical protein
MSADRKQAQKRNCSQVKVQVSLVKLLKEKALQSLGLVIISRALQISRVVSAEKRESGAPLQEKSEQVNKPAKFSG